MFDGLTIVLRGVMIFGAPLLWMVIADEFREVVRATVKSR